jgi:hypothetical protein
LIPLGLFRAERLAKRVGIEKKTKTAVARKLAVVSPSHLG